MEAPQKRLVQLPVYYNSRKTLHFRFAVSSINNIFVTCDTGVTFTLDVARGVLVPFQWPDPNFTAHELVCMMVEPSVLDVVFGGVHSAPAECMWILDQEASQLSLYHMTTKRLVRITACNDGSEVSPDGAALVSPNRQPGQTLGSLQAAFSFVCLKNYVVVLESLIDGTRVRSLDLKTWQLRTDFIALKDREWICRIHQCMALDHSIVETSVLVELSDRDVQYDLVKRVTSDALQFPFVVKSGDRCYPIASSWDVPAYIIRGYPHQLVKVVNGSVHIGPHPNSRRDLRMVHIASMDVSVISMAYKGQVGAEFLWIFAKPDWKERLASNPIQLPPSDLSSLINNDLFSLDVIVKKDHKEWKLSTEILQKLHPYLHAPKLKDCVEPFSSDTVDVFIGFLFGKPLPKGDTTDSIRLWSQAIYLWRELSIGDNIPLLNFSATVLPSIPSSLACASLVDIWNDEKTNWVQTDPIIEALGGHVKNHCYQELVDFLLSRPSSRNMLLAFAVSTIKDTKSTNIVAKEVPLRGLPKVQLKPAALTFFPKALLTKPNDFLFQLSPPHARHVILGDMLYLYTRWNWFKRLIDVGGAEKKNRIAEMPSWMSLPCARAILSCVHSNSFGEVLSTSDSLELLDHRREMDFVDSNDVPIEPFKPLIEACQEVLFPITNTTNVLKQIQSYHRLAMTSKVKELLGLVASGFYPVGALNLLDELSSDLLTQLKEQRDDWMESERIRASKSSQPASSPSKLFPSKMQPVLRR